MKRDEVTKLVWNMHYLSHLVGSLYETLSPPLSAKFRVAATAHADAQVPLGKPATVPADAGERVPGDCCPYRRKILVSVQAVLPEATCGVPDSMLADLFRPDMKVPGGQPVLAFRFCPWCGTPRPLEGEHRITFNPPEAP